jgi:iron complex outermembrane receptor protein
MPYSGTAQEDAQDIEDISLDALLNVQISTAAKYQQTVSEAPASVTIITSEDIERYGYRTLEEVLAGVRGFYVSNDRNYSYIGIRGFGRPTDYNNRILILINGYTINEGFYQSAYVGTAFPLDLNGVERIEIVRGPGSALYGTSAMFAVVNIITKKGAMTDGVKLSAVTGSYGRLQGKAAFGKEFDNDVDAFISCLWSDIQGQEELYYEEYDNPTTNNGIAEDLDWDKHYGLLATVSYSDFILQGIISSREGGVPTGAWEMDFNDDNAKTLDEHQFVEFKYDSDISADKNLMTRGYLRHYGYEGTYPYQGTNMFDINDSDWLGSEIRFRWDPRSDNRLIAGAEYQNHFREYYRYWDADTTYIDDDFAYSTFSLYIQDEYQVIKELSLTLGIRRDEYSSMGGSTTPRAGIVYNPVKSGTLKLLYGEAFRAPNVDVSRAKKIMTLTGVPDYVELGLSVAIGIKGRKPQITINLPAAKAEGINFSSQLLKLAKVIME